MRALPPIEEEIRRIVREARSRDLFFVSLA
jgi:hypothetical protein